MSEDERVDPAIHELLMVLGMAISRVNDEDWDTGVAAYYLGLLSGVMMKHGHRILIPAGTKEERIAAFNRFLNI